MIKITEEMEKIILDAQKEELTSYKIYKKLSTKISNKNNAKILNDIALEEKNHYNILKSITNKETKASKFKYFFYYFVLRFLGLTFGIRLMERGEEKAQKIYSDLLPVYPQIRSILSDEENHEEKLIGMINEEFLSYVSSIVLGLSDALVELTGALTGFTFALQNTELIAVIGFITGISAALSMGASEYLSSLEESDEINKSPLKSSMFTGFTYLIVVIILITPFLIIANDPFLSLAISVSSTIIIIFCFTYYVSVTKDIPFIPRFVKVASISLGTAFISLLIGFGVKIVFGIDV